MLICTVSSDVLIISLLKTCLHYPGDTRNVNAAFPVKCGPMGTTRVSLCSPWLVVWQWRCSTAERGTQGAQGARRVTAISSHPFWRNRGYFYFGLCFFWAVHVWSRQPISPVLGVLSQCFLERQCVWANGL